MGDVDPSTSLTLNATVVASAFASNGNPDQGQVASLTSTNNFINFCLTYPNLPITNGTQINTGSCNPAPMGSLPSVQNIPSAKFIFPKYGDNVQPNSEFTVSLSIRNMQTAAFVNAQTSYLAAPQQLNGQGVVIGNPVVILEQIPGLNHTEPSNPLIFTFFKGVPEAPVNGALQISVTGGLPPGVYRLSTQLRTANHQPVVISAAQHGAIDDVVYFMVGDGNGSVSEASSAVVGNSIVAAAINTQDSAQSSLTLDPKVIASGFASSASSVPGQTVSLSSTNNFINYCMDVPELPITNGAQVQAGSCNPVPMGILPSSKLMPSSKFTNPKNGDNIPAGKSFSISLAIRNFQTGALTSTERSYLAAPQQVNAQGLIIGNAKVVIEALTGFNQTTPTDPSKYAFFQHIGSTAQGGILTASVDDGLPDGYYRLSSILTAANSQPVIMPVSQHGYVNDAVYFTVGDPTKAVFSNNGTTGANNGTTTTPDQSTTSSPPGVQVDKAAIIGGVLGGVLGAIILCGIIYAIIRYRRHKRMLSDTEAARLPFATPFEVTTPNPYYRHEKGQSSRGRTESSSAASSSVAGSEQMAESSRTALIRSHGEIVESRKSRLTEPPPYRP